MLKRKFAEKDVPKGIEIRYFHIRVNGRIVETVCNLMSQGGAILSTGHAYVSPKDNPSKKIGRAISCGRALKLYYYYGEA